MTQPVWYRFGMNRWARRAKKSVERKGSPVSVEFMRKQYAELEQQTGQLRDTLFAIARAQGRILVKKSDLRELEPGDRIDVEEIDKDGASHIQITFVHAEAGGEKTSLIALRGGA